MDLFIIISMWHENQGWDKSTDIYTNIGRLTFILGSGFASTRPHHRPIPPWPHCGSCFPLHSARTAWSDRLRTASRGFASYSSLLSFLFLRRRRARDARNGRCVRVGRHIVFRGRAREHLLLLLVQTEVPENPYILSSLGIGLAASFSTSDSSRKSSISRIGLSENALQLEFVASGEFWKRESAAVRARREVEKLCGKERKMWAEFIKRFGVILRDWLICNSWIEGAFISKETQKRENSIRRVPRQREKDTSELSRRRSILLERIELIVTKPLSSFDNDLYVYSRP